MSNNPRHKALVQRFRELLAAFEDWKCHQGEPGTYEEAGRIIAQLTALLRDSGFGEVEFHRFCADARDHDEDDQPDQSVPDDAGLLRGLARLTGDFAPAVVGPILARTLSSDALLRSKGEASPVGGDIPVANHQQRYPTLIKGARELSILLAHYLAGRNDTNWLVEHQGMVGGLSHGGRNKWNHAASISDRELARAAGERRRQQAPLSAEELAMEEHVLHHPVERICEKLEQLRRGGKTP